MDLKALVQKIDAAAQDWLLLKNSQDEAITAWAGLHGWNAAEAESQRLIVRQAALNAMIRQKVIGEQNAFATPLDSLGVEVPQSLADVVSESSLHYQSTLFNFWGELYSALIPQAYRRRIGQFWTDEQIAEWMVGWLLQDCPKHLTDIGCGAGNFLLKAAQLLKKVSISTTLYGCDLSPLLLNLTLAAYQSQAQDAKAHWPLLVQQNYLESALPAGTDAVICNPPYTRHHHISADVKDALQAFLKKQLFTDVSRQGTLAYFFLLKLIAEMPEGARAAIIVPMEVLDARYGKAAKWVLSQHTRLSALIHFSPQMNAFRKVDVGASILLFSKGYEKGNQTLHLTLNSLPTTDDLLECFTTKHLGNRELGFGSLVIQPQDELLETPKWFSISTPKPSNNDWQQSGLVVPLKSLAKVVRGIATGANEFFVLPTRQVEQRGLEPYVVRTLHRNREVQDIILDETRWEALSVEGKCVWLLYLNGDDVSGQTKLQAYLEEGEARGFHRRALVQTRKKWYAMEQRDVPPIFFTILTRGNPRFILNQADVRPVNMFSLIYPNHYVTDADAVEILWALLNSNFSLSRLHSVSRTYGGNTLKVEPRELDNLPVINPLALSEENRLRSRGWIDDFYRNRQSSVLINQVNGLIDTLLMTERGRISRSSLPVQLRLLEGEESYGPEQAKD